MKNSSIITILSHAKTRFILTFVLGLLSALAYAPFQLWPLLCISFSGFAYFLFQTKTLKQALLIAFVFFTGYYGGTLYWVGHAFGVVGMGWLSPVAYIGFPCALSVVPTLASLLAWRLSHTQSPRYQALTLGAFLSLSFLSQMLSQLAFPWVMPGYALPLEIQQITAWIGIEGLTFLTLIGSFFLFARSKIYTALSLSVFATLAIFGFIRLRNESFVTAYNFRIIQPSIQQDTKWDPEQTQRNLQIQGLLSQMDAEKPIQAVIWPEAAVTFDFSKYPEVQKMLGNAAPEGGYVFLGSVRESEGNPHSSLVVLDDSGIAKAIYDKKHLVPFGEYVPYRTLLPGINKLTQGARDFVCGERSEVIALPKIPPFRALICYEAIFSREILDPSWRNPKPSGHWIVDGVALDDDPKWLLNLTNDAWYGDSSGPHQHLYNVRVRAIEQGLPLVRAANNGISAVIDPYGRIIHKLALNEIGIIDFTLPEALPTTFYAHYGMWIVFILIGISGLIIGCVLMRGRSHKPLS